MAKCIQCEKEAIMVVGGNPLCVDCFYKLQLASQMQQNQIYQHMNMLLDNIEMSAGVSGLFPRHKISQPNIFKGPLTYNNIKVDNSIVGSINTGEIGKLDINIEKIKTAGNNQEFAELLKEFTQAILDEHQLNNEIKNELLEQLSFAVEQINIPKMDQKKSIIKPILLGIKDTISAFATLSTIWEKLYPYLHNLI